MKTFQSIDFGVSFLLQRNANAILSADQNKHTIRTVLGKGRNADMRYYIADTHFFHRSLNEKMDQRGFEDIEQMNEYMIDQWNSKVRKNDEVVVLGDFSWGNASQTTEILDELKGKIYLIRGNHDRFLDDKNFDASRFVWIMRN